MVVTIEVVAVAATTEDTRTQSQYFSERKEKSFCRDAKAFFMVISIRYWRINKVQGTFSITMD